MVGGADYGQGSSREHAVITPAVSACACVDTIAAAAR
ncbi:hypothetical protein [Nonomuraea dietziae]